MFDLINLTVKSLKLSEGESMCIQNVVIQETTTLGVGATLHVHGVCHLGEIILGEGSQIVYLDDLE